MKKNKVSITINYEQADIISDAYMYYSGILWIKNYIPEDEKLILYSFGDQVIVFLESLRSLHPKLYTTIPLSPEALKISGNLEFSYDILDLVIRLFDIVFEEGVRDDYTFKVMMCYPVPDIVECYEYLKQYREDMLC